MGKIGLIIAREYLTRVRKPAFILLTLLGPILFAALSVGPVLIARYSDEVKTIGVVDSSRFFFSALKEKETSTIKFTYIPVNQFDKEIASLGKSPLYGVLKIPVNAGGGYQGVINRSEIFTEKNVGLGLKSFIESVLSEEIRNQELIANDIDPALVDKTKHAINLKTTSTADGGKQNKSAEVSTAVGLVLGFVIYMFIFIYGSMVLRGVIEEKTSRIVEVIVSSVKPFQLMMGKIIGVGMVGLTQFVIWIVLGVVVSTAAQSMIIGDQYEAKQVVERMAPEAGQKIDANLADEADKKANALEAINAIKGLPFARLLFAFLFYFLGGYLLYGAFFAAIGGAVDSETDTQQFMLPVTIPIIFAIIMMQFVLNNPDGPVAFWLSIIPLTSPIIMMVRIPFDPPVWQVMLSMFILFITFVSATWLAGRIYRTGILMYGKKPTWREMGKWLFYKG